MTERLIAATAFLGGALALALAVVNQHAAIESRQQEKSRQIDDWENEGGALRTAPQQPGTT